MQVEEKNYLNEPIRWSKGINAEFPYQTIRDNSRLIIRVNDFPEEPFYTLIVNDQEIKDFDDWPNSWIRAENGEEQQETSGADFQLEPLSVLEARPSSVAGLWPIGSVNTERFNTLLLHLIDYCSYALHHSGFSAVAETIESSLSGYRDQATNLQAGNSEHIKVLTRGVEFWNDWRVSNPLIQPDLSGINLEGAQLSNINLSRTFLVGANLQRADLSNARLDSSNLTAANLAEANLSKALLNNSILPWASFERANLQSAWLSEIKCFRTKFSKAKLIGASIKESDLFETDLSGADLRECRFNYSRLVNSKFRDANLSNCSVYGVSAWDIDLSNALQTDLLISSSDEPSIAVDNIEFAQFLFMVLKSNGVQNVIRSVSSQAVLIIGYFPSNRTSVLNALREELRRQNYSPIVIQFRDFERNLTSQIISISRLAKFIVADISNSTPFLQQLQEVAENVSSPIQPIIEGIPEPEKRIEEQLKSSTFLTTSYYRDADDLSELLKERVIAQAEAKVLELLSDR